MAVLPGRTACKNQHAHARFILLTQMPAEAKRSVPLILDESKQGIRNRSGARNGTANVQELLEASHQPIQKPDLALKDSLSGIVE